MGWRALSAERGGREELPAPAGQRRPGSARKRLATCMHGPHVDIYLAFGSAAGRQWFIRSALITSLPDDVINQTVLQFANTPVGFSESARGAPPFCRACALSPDQSLCAQRGCLSWLGARSPTLRTRASRRNSARRPSRSPHCTSGRWASTIRGASPPLKR